MEIIIAVLAVYYIIGLVLCALIYSFIRKEYGGMGEFCKLAYNAPAEVVDSYMYRVTVAFLFVTLVPFATPVLFVVGFCADWKDRKEED